MKVTLVEKQKTGKRLSEQLGRDPATVTQLLTVNLKDLLNSCSK